MGALIRTKGTKRIIAHLNEEFSTYIEFYRDNQISTQFDTSKGTYPGLLGLTLTIEDSKDDIHAARPNDDLVLLPNLSNTVTGGGKGHGKKKHPRLEARWLWFLNTNNYAQDSLTLANDKTIADAIYLALTKKTAGVLDYTSICFDAVESNSAQDVDVSDQSDLGNTKYMLITLKTNKAMPTAAGPGMPPPIDD